MNIARLTTIMAASATVLLAGTSAEAASTISRLTPPSALFTFGDANPPVIARFLPGQRFDLQATVQPDSGLSVTSVAWKVDGSTVTPVAGATSLKTTGLVAGLATNSAVASLRGYSNATAGTHTFIAEATMSDGSKVSATGNFEVVGYTATGRKAKNLIIMIGDGMGIAHRTAARIMLKGVSQGKANEPLAMDTFPVTGIVETASLNSIITDSAPGAACYSTGNKGNNNQQGVFPDDTSAAFDNPRVELVGEYLARTNGKSLGIVTTADVFDATPGAFGSHTANRGAGTGICDQYLDEMVPKANLTVLLGGGRKWFLPSTTTGSARGNSSDYTLDSDIVAGWNLSSLPAATGALDANRDLIGGFTTAGFTYVSDQSGLASSGAGATKLLGLFSFSNMNVALDKIAGRRGTSSVVASYGFPDQPMLDEMTTQALQVLNKNPNGFVLMVEAASIDKQAHNMDTERWILDTIEFDHTIAVARDFQAANPDTLVIITADHECAGVNIIGAATVTHAALTSKTGTALRDSVVGTYENAGFPQYSIAADGYPVTTDVDYRMLVGYAANSDRYEDWVTNPLPLQDSQQPTSGTAYGSIVNTLPATPLNRDTAGNFLVTGQVPGSSAVHTGSDIPVSALGRGSAAFTGVMDNTDVYFRAMQAVLGGAK